MELKIGSEKMDLYNGVTVSLQYDSVASVFAFVFYFDPDNAAHKKMFKPGSYQPCTIVSKEGELMLTGILLGQNFKDSAKREYMSVTGYSKTGVLEDCEIPTSAYPLQRNGLTLEQITKKVIEPFGLKLIVDSSVSSKVSSAYKASTAQDSQNCKQYLAEMAGQKHVMLSHDEKGNLLLTEAKVNAPAIFDFATGMPGIDMELNFDGQGMHSSITMIKQQTKGRKDGTHKRGNAGQATVDNPYVPAGVFRPRVSRQTSGQDVDTENAARNFLSQDLKGLSLKITMQGWTLGGKIVRPNSIITVTNPNLYLYNKTKWFIAGVEYQGDENSETAVLTCYVPEVFSTGTPKNIFD